MINANRTLKTQPPENIDVIFFSPAGFLLLRLLCRARKADKEECIIWFPVALSDNLTVVRVLEDTVVGNMKLEGIEKREIKYYIYTKHEHTKKIQ